MAKLTKTSTPGIFRSHKKGCVGTGRCDCSYVVIWRHRGRQHKESYRTYAEAREAKASRDVGDRRPASKVRIGDYFDEWIDGYGGRTSRGFSETSRTLYRRAVTAHALPTWRTWKLAELEPADVRSLFMALSEKGRSRATLKTLRGALSAMYATAAEDGLVAANPIRGVRLPGVEDEGQKRAKGLTGDELRVFLEAVPEDGYWQLFFEFLAVTGLRVGEAVGLTWENLELGDGPRAKVREQVYRGERKRLKSREGKRDVPLSESMAARLLAHRRDTYGGPAAPVFATSKGTALDPQNVRRTVLRPAAIATGHFELVEEDGGELREKTTLGFHAFRHTCASLLFAEGRNVKQVQEWLGHATPTITLDTYVHLMDEGIGEALEIRPRGNKKATQGPQTAANETGGIPAKLAA